uniref:Glycosyltransferase, GT2 family n=1 Tax=Candidatus Kentrum sp. FM TaxID=2126340 RepID=A0A450TKD1_9GAMM|nr:MAG: Glycosyltransferase, GT2 family [Candidatus Kentron sp. FM]VFJ68040.1 MAG: Glycosyltransferase, GT2 family [Candidatus Kentron sp. FM]VFK16811.1 MAG: Glycosyltransferase, GT2 family [Candidatus Kentron sp. FM]
MDTLSASVVITARNRREETLRAVASSLCQDFRELEVLVFDDASDDGTSRALTETTPRIRLFALTERKGYIVNRNRGFREAKGDIVFSLDDDAYFSRPDIVARIMTIFENDPSVGAVAIPFIEPLNVRSLSSLRSPFRAKAGDELQGYVGCAHALRKELALQLGGYRAYFVHQGEERDLCLRLLDAGYRIVYADCAHIVHTVSPRREAMRVDFYGARNLILFDWLNLPWPNLIVRLIWDPVAMLRYRFTWRAVPGRLRAIGAGFIEAARRYRERKPVSPQTYARYRRLPGHGPEEWNGPAPAPCKAPE